MPVNVDEDGQKLTIDEQSVDGISQEVRDAAEVTYGAANVEAVWSLVKDWAAAWEEYPGEGQYYEGYFGLVAAAGQALRLGQTDETAGDQEQWARRFIDLKDVWATISRDPTEAGGYSENLTALSFVLSERLQAVAPLKAWMDLSLPQLEGISNRFLQGKYDCHQNAAKDAKAQFDRFDFAQCCTDLGVPATRISTLVSEWEDKEFSTRI